MAPATSSTYITTAIDGHTLEDQSNPISIYELKQKDFHSLSFDPPGTTKFSWPTSDDPESFFKFSSFWIE